MPEFILSPTHHGLDRAAPDTEVSSEEERGLVGSEAGHESDDADTELLSLASLLDDLADEDDVRPLLRRRCQMPELISVWAASGIAISLIEDGCRVERPSIRPKAFCVVCSRH